MDGDEREVSDEEYIVVVKILFVQPPANAA